MMMTRKQKPDPVYNWLIWFFESLWSFGRDLQHYADSLREDVERRRCWGVTPLLEKSDMEILKRLKVKFGQFYRLFLSVWGQMDAYRRGK